jgi:hypothetical protein
MDLVQTNLEVQNVPVGGVDPGATNSETYGMSIDEIMERRPKRGQASEDFDLRSRLLRLGIKQVHFADYIGRDQSGLRRWIAGNPRPPGEVEMLIDLLDHHILGLPKPLWLDQMEAKYGPDAPPPSRARKARVDPEDGDG